MVKETGIPQLAGFKLTISVVIGTDFIGSCKSNYHTFTVMTDLRCERWLSDTSSSEPLVWKCEIMYVFNTIDINEHKCVCINHVKFTMNKKEKSGFVISLEKEKVWICQSV